MFECNKLFLLSPIQGFQLDFYVHESVNDAAKRASPPRHVGYTFILPLDLQRTTDKKTVPITSLKHKPLGQVTCKYLELMLIIPPPPTPCTNKGFWWLSRNHDVFPSIFLVNTISLKCIN